MNAIVVHRKLSSVEIDKIAELVIKEKMKLFNVSSFRYDKLASLQTPLDYSINDDRKKEISHYVFNRVVGFGERTFDSKKISQLVGFDETNLWYYYKYRAYFFFKSIYEERELISIISKKGNFNKLFWYGSNPIYLEGGSSNKNIQFFLPNKEHTNGIKLTLQYGLFTVVRFLIGYFQLRKLKSNNFLVDRPNNWQSILNKHHLSVDKDNPFIGYLLQKSASFFTVLIQVDTPKKNQKHFNLFDNKYWKYPRERKKLFVEYILFGGMINPKVRRLVKTTDSKIKKAIDKLLTKNKPTDIDKLFLYYILGNGGYNKLILFKYFSYINFFSKTEVRSITSVDENNPEIRVIFDAAKRTGVKTFAIQHGIIHPLNPAYSYNMEDVNSNATPDLTFVWGESWKKRLVQFNYNPDSIKVVGQLRTDIIPTLLNKFNPHKNDKDFKVMYASQPLKDEEYRKKALNDVLKMAKQLNNIQLIVRPHPGENDDSFFHESAHDVGCENYILSRNEDLYVQLAKCNLVVTCFSTVGVEAVYFNKPLIIIDYYNEDIQGYHNDGIAYQANTGEKLFEIVRDFSLAELKHDSNAYEKYISKFAHRIDGKVGERIMTEIMKSPEPH